MSNPNESKAENKDHPQTDFTIALPKPNLNNVLGRDNPDTPNTDGVSQIRSMIDQFSTNSGIEGSDESIPKPEHDTQGLEMYLHGIFKNPEPFSDATIEQAPTHSNDSEGEVPTDTPGNPQAHESLEVSPKTAAFVADVTNLVKHVEEIVEKAAHAVKHGVEKAIHDHGPKDDSQTGPYAAPGAAGISDFDPLTPGMAAQINKENEEHSKK